LDDDDLTVNALHIYTTGFEIYLFSFIFTLWNWI